ncbi:MAG TPA: hypothetical protein VLF68_03040 [Candidatus Saccharimonadales bacterium]|nr:hypothetical protein [Candidatus Saccharimonadales bacterium]
MANQKAVKHPAINFVAKQRGVFDKFIDWSLTVGRAIVMITEIIALVAFLYRFSLDRTLVDLHDQIKQRANVVSYLKSSEETYRSLQDRISYAKTYSTQGQKQVKVFQDILGLVPSTLIVQSITLNDTTLKIDANALSVSGLTTFVNALRSYKGIASVSVDRIENNPSSALISISLTATMQKL